MILVCIAVEDEEAPVRAAAESLARGLELRIGVVLVMDEKRRLDPSPMSWTLQTEAPAEPLLNFARLNRTRHIILGPKAWERWGKAIWEKGSASGDLALSWSIPSEKAMYPGLSLEDRRPGRWRRAINVLKRLIYRIES